MAKPVHEIRIGLIKVHVWRRRARSHARHSVSVVRLYRDGDLWKESTRFGRDDLLALCHAIDRAHSWIIAHDSTIEHRSRNG